MSEFMAGQQMMVAAMRSHVLQASGPEWERRVFIHKSGAVFLPSPLADEGATLTKCRADKAPYVEDEGHYYFNTVWLHAACPQCREQLVKIMQSLRAAGIVK